MKLKPETILQKYSETLPSSVYVIIIVKWLQILTT